MADEASPADLKLKEMRETRVQLDIMRKRGRTDLGLWLTMRGKDFVMLPDRTPFNDWRVHNKLDHLTAVDLLIGGEIRRCGHTLKLAHKDGGPFITQEEYGIALDIIELCVLDVCNHDSD